jgi:hypothetical protein
VAEEVTCYCATPAEGTRGQLLLSGERLDTQRGPAARHETVEACLRAWVERQAHGLSGQSEPGTCTTDQEGSCAVVVARYRVGARVADTRHVRQLEHLQTVGHFRVFAGWSAKWREVDRA